MQNQIQNNPVFVYVFSARVDGIITAPCKIGIAANPAGRLALFQTACPLDLVLIDIFETPTREAALFIERQTHKKLAHFRIRGEWFGVSPEYASKVVQDLIWEDMDKCFMAAAQGK